MTNNGFANYRSGSVEWRKSWCQSCRPRSAAPSSKTETTTENFSMRTPNPRSTTTVSYNGNLVRRTKLHASAPTSRAPAASTTAGPPPGSDKRLNVEISSAAGRLAPASTKSAPTRSRSTAPATTLMPIPTSPERSRDQPQYLPGSRLKTSRGAVTLEAKISNILDRLPYAEAPPTPPLTKRVAQSGPASATPTD